MDALTKVMQEFPDWRDRLEAVRRMSPGVGAAVLERLVREDPASLVRGAAMDAMGDQLPGRVLEEVARHDPNARIRFSAVSRLDSKQHRFTLADVALQDPDREVRAAAATRLPVPNEAHTLAAIALRDPDQRNVRLALELLATPQTQDRLASAARTARAPDTRRAAVELLDPATQGETLVQLALTDGCEYVRRAAVERMDPAIHQDALAKYAQRGQPENVRLAAIPLLDASRHGELLEQLVRENWIPGGRLAAMRKLAEADPEHADRIAEVLRDVISADPNPLVRMLAIRHIPESVLGRMQSVLATAARGDDEEPARAAVDRIDMAIHGTLVVDLALGSKSWVVREGALQRCDPVAHDGILAAAAERDPDCYPQATALRRLNPERWPELFARRARSIHPPVRFAAAERLFGEEHGDLLRGIASTDPEEDVRELARARLAQGRWARAPEHDRRVQHGDDFAGDAWRDVCTGEVAWGGVGQDRNAGVAGDGRRESGPTPRAAAPRKG